MAKPVELFSTVVKRIQPLRSLQPFNDTKMTRACSGIPLLSNRTPPTLLLMRPPRLPQLSCGLDPIHLDLPSLVSRIQMGLPVPITAHELDGKNVAVPCAVPTLQTFFCKTHTATTAAGLGVRHPDYTVLASRLCVADLHKTMEKSLLTWVTTYSACDAGSAPIPLTPAQETMRILILTLSPLSRSTRVGEHYSPLVRLRAELLYTHATPTLFNVGTTAKSFASCFLCQPDATGALSLTSSALQLDRFWANNGSIGMSLATVPVKRDMPRTQGGVLPLMKIHDAHAQFMSIFLSGMDVLSFIRCRTARTPNSDRVRNVYPVLGVPDVFDWCLFDPIDVPTLNALHGEHFTAAYDSCVCAGHALMRVSAPQLWNTICNAQRESGTPFVMLKDNVNGAVHTKRVSDCRNNQSHLGLIASSNICTEIVQYSSHLKTAFRLRGVPGCCEATTWIAFWTARSILHLRAHAQSTAHVPSVSAYKDSRTCSWPLPCLGRLARVCGNTVHVAYHGECISQYGLRNSLITAQMPTASTSYLLGNTPEVEPLTSNIVTHQLISGNFTEICPWLVRDLVAEGMCDEAMRLAIIAGHGIESIPATLRNVYRTAWEIEPFAVVDMAGDRTPYIEQSQSLSLSIVDLSTALLMHLQTRAWELGLKTGLYYLHTCAPAFPLPFGLDDILTSGAEVVPVNLPALKPTALEAAVEAMFDFAPFIACRGCSA
ncbi:ribonucleotide reductase [Earliella scabrosa]|nr:ribonucleotide reductase [Earliella scabrosa]